MICESCMTAADLNLQNEHKRCKGCDCQHRPLKDEPERADCNVCGRNVYITRVGRVLHWHKDNRSTKYGKWGLRCPGSGKKPQR